MSSDDLLSHFGPLDELIQVIYQGHLKFVVLSAVDEVSWTVHVGLSGDEGRWWRGRWTEKDVRKTVGAKSSSKLLDAVADRLADTFVQGELYVGNWSAEKGAEINLTVGPDAKTPVHVPLTELAPGEAAAFATKVFTQIALQAQARKCRLHPSSYEPPAASTRVARSMPSSSRPTASSSRVGVTEEIEHSKAEPAEPRRSRRTDQAETDPRKPVTESNRKRGHSPDAQREIRKLKAQLSRTETQLLESGQSKPDTSKLQSIAKGSRAPAGQPRIGASLANPTKKRRKYQAIEFGSDED